MTEKHLEALLQENRVIDPPPEFAAKAVVRDPAVYKVSDREKFWEGFARELHWFSPWSRALEWKAPHAKWFVGGKTN
ncbi:MAG TPA: acetyl-coenzyme A synthetase N-terminal domain-containing protein, partial [Planctomycetota bacterium]